MTIKKTYFAEDSIFLQADTRGSRWAIPYNFECLNARVENILAKNRDTLHGQRVLDLASHIGTFSYAALNMGADFVHGVDTEGRTVEKCRELFQEQGVDPSRYQFEIRDVFDLLEDSPPNCYDTILCCGLLYYTTEPLRLLQLMSRAARKFILLDTFTAGYAAIQGKDAFDIYPRIQDETLELPMMLTSRTQSGKKDYRLPQSFDLNGKDLSLTTFPTRALLEIWFQSLGMKYQCLDWSDYATRDRSWRDLVSPEQKKASHWADIYSSGVRVSYLLDVTGSSAG
jgi:predicted nicotinamide N-methyase